MTHYDLHISGGTVVDGSGAPRFVADVWIRDGRVAQVGGRVTGSSARTIDATGQIVAPGFIDLHTHYDAQIRWDPYCSISGWHGVTTVVLGNCGFGFAPVKPDMREISMLMMTRTEAIPLDSLREGLLPKWTWETVPEYLEGLANESLGVNCLHFVPLVPLMIYVMGLDAAKSRPATKAEQEQMKALLHEAMDAGACGFSFQRQGPSSAQTDHEGSPMVTDTMCDEDLLALAEVLAERDEGFIQLTQLTSRDPNDPGDAAFKERLAQVAKRPLLDNLVPVTDKIPELHRARLEWLRQCNDRGLRIFGQCATFRSGVIIRFDHWNLYDLAPAWKEATTGTHEEKLAKFADLELRERIKADTDEKGTIFRSRLSLVGGPLEDLVVTDVNGQPEFEHYSGQSIRQIAEAEGKHYIDAMLDLALATDLKAEFMGLGRPYNPEYMAGQILESPVTVPGLSDGGAHTKFFIGGGWTTDFLRWLVRDEKRITLEQAHYRLSGLPAIIAGVPERGLLREGGPADIVVYDLEKLELEPEWVGEIVYDLPGGEWRRIQRGGGYTSIIVNGVETFANGKCTQETPGAFLPVSSH